MRGNYVKRLRGMCTLRVLLWRLAKSGRRVCPSAKLESFKEAGSVSLQKRSKRERHACPSAVVESRVLPCFVYNRVVFSCMEKSVDICHVHISQRGNSFSSGTQTLAESSTYVMKALKCKTLGSSALLRRSANNSASHLA